MLRLLYLFIYGFLWIGLTTACQTSTHQAIKSYELQYHSCSITGHIYIRAITPYYAADSLLALEREYIEVKQKKLESLMILQLEEEARVQNIMLECHTMSDGPMKRIMLKRVDEIRLRIKQIQNLHFIYSSYPDKTQLRVYADRMEFYRANPRRLIGYVVEAEFSGKEGDLPINLYQKSFFFDSHKKVILAEIKFVS